MLKFEDLRSDKRQFLRAKVRGGWLVTVAQKDAALAFVPDPKHQWDGGSLP
jgi:hypothetical protein